MNCTVCHRPLEGHFRITRVTKEAPPNEVAQLCSVTCIARWTYEYSKMQGARVAFKAHNIWQQLKDVFK